MRVSFLLFFLLTCFGSYSQSSIYYGKWIYVNKSSNTILNLDENGFFYIEVDGDKFGGKEFVQDGFVLESKYHIDSSEKPIKIDLFFINKKSGKPINHIKGILEFISSDKMKICMDESGGERPDYFYPKMTKVFERIIN